jgi:aspartate beta-hydroxylase
MKSNHSANQPGAAWQINVLADSAQKLAEQGEIAEAERLYRTILQNAPFHVRALNFLAVRSMERNELNESIGFLEQALRADPNRPILYQNLGLVYKARGEFDSALAALDRAISLRPDLSTALFHKGSVLEALGRPDEAISCYWQGWNGFPSADLVASTSTGNSSLSKLFSHTVEMIRTTQLQLIAEALEPLRIREGSEPIKNVELCAKNYVGLNDPQYADALQRPSFLYLPGIQSRAFFERSEFPWITELEAATPMIRDELIQVLDTEIGLTPYVHVEEGVDAFQWKELANSLKWSAFHLYKAGTQLKENCMRCPVTVERTAKYLLPKIPGHAPEMLFSILKPGTHIPPHYGLGNYKLAVHLPLIVPNDCTIRVGNEQRTWSEGQCLIFDDSFEHEAWNRSASVRAVLILEIWNPQVSEVEREAIITLVSTINAFRERYASRHSVLK